MALALLLSLCPPPPSLFLSLPLVMSFGLERSGAPITHSLLLYGPWCSITFCFPSHKSTCTHSHECTHTHPHSHLSPQGLRLMAVPEYSPIKKERKRESEGGREGKGKWTSLFKRLYVLHRLWIIKRLHYLL